VIDEQYLQEVIRQKIELSCGKLDHTCTIDNMIVLMWDFQSCTQCSNASKRNFIGARMNERLFEFPNAPKATTSLPFFIIDDKDIFRDEANQIVKETYVYPEVTEKARQNALQKSLQAAQYNVYTSDSAKTTAHFCEFSGGGDLYIAGDNSSALVLVTLENDSPAMDAGSSAINEDSLATNEGSSVTNQGSLLVESAQGSSSPSMITRNKKKSPIHVGEAKLASLNFELKKDHFIIDKLKHQLWANMINVTVNNFVLSFKDTSMTKQYLIGLKQLTGYGIACTGDGIFGVFKLEMDLISGSISFITKVKLGSHDKIKAVALMDFTLEYFKDKTHS